MDVAEFHKYLETTFREWRDEERIAALFAKIIPERNNTLKLQWWANVLAGAEAKGLVVFNAATLASLFHHPSSLSPKCIPEVLVWGTLSVVFLQILVVCFPFRFLIRGCRGSCESSGLPSRARNSGDKRGSGREYTHGDYDHGHAEHQQHE
jgi:hypothetical protein